MPRPSAVRVRERLATGFALDHLWRDSVGLPEGDSKEHALRRLTKSLSGARTPYALIGGVAVQLYTEEPRTTRDVDVAMASYDAIPRESLERAGFKHEGRFEHSDNWRAPGSGPRRQRTAIQFMVDRLTGGVVERAETFRVHGMRIRVAALPDLVLLKLEAAEEPSRRESKRQSDVADVLRLMEEHPELARAVPDAQQRLARIVTRTAAVLRDRGR